MTDVQFRQVGCYGRKIQVVTPVYSRAWGRLLKTYRNLATRGLCSHCPLPLEHEAPCSVLARIIIENNN